MPKFNVNVPHTLTQPEARSRLERFAEMLEKKFKSQISDLHQSWENDTLQFRFKTYGIPLQGGITVGEHQLTCAGDLPFSAMMFPFSAMMFRGKIESSIRE
jgi:hypothetical protein